MDLVLVLGFLGIFGVSAYRGITIRFRDETHRETVDKSGDDG